MPTATNDRVGHENLVGPRQLDEVAVATTAAVLRTGEREIAERDARRELDEDAAALEVEPVRRRAGLVARPWGRGRVETYRPRIGDGVK